jgi:hypothetical protein
MAAQTYTYTWTQTRLDTIQDQFRYFMTYGNIAEQSVDKVVYGVGEKVVEAVGLYACDSSQLKVIEAELKVDWDRNATLSLSVPTITSGLSGWGDGKQAPEIKVAGRRFAQTAERLQLGVRFWVQFTQSVWSNQETYKAWCSQLGLSAGSHPPGWKAPPENLPETLMDLNELEVTLRRASGA